MYDNLMYFTVKFIDYSKEHDERAVEIVLMAKSKKQVINYLLTSGIIGIDTLFSIDIISAKDISQFDNELVYSFVEDMNIIKDIKLHTIKVPEYQRIKAMNNIRSKLTPAEIKLLGIESNE